MGLARPIRKLPASHLLLLHFRYCTYELWVQRWAPCKRLVRIMITCAEQSADARTEEERERDREIEGEREKER